MTAAGVTHLREHEHASFSRVSQVLFSAVVAAFTAAHRNPVNFGVFRFSPVRGIRHAAAMQLEKEEEKKPFMQQNLILKEIPNAAVTR